MDFVRPLVDRIKLADTFWSAQCLKGRAAKNDRIDVRDLAGLEIGGQIEEGYQMPKDLRGVRDVLRTRMRLVQGRTAKDASFVPGAPQHAPNCTLKYQRLELYIQGRVPPPLLGLDRTPSGQS